MKTAEGPDINRPIPQKSTSMTFLDALNTLDDNTREAVMERVAIMQYDGLLSREAAERAALAAYELDKADPLETLADFLRYFPFAMCAEDGTAITKWGNPENLIRSREELSAVMRGEGDARGVGIGQRLLRFAFQPGPSGFLVFDIDRGHADKRDGVAELAARLAGKPVGALFANLDSGSFPAYTRTPSGGFHLYFRYTGTKQFGPQTIAPAVEVKHFGALITAPGSERGARLYTFFGSLKAAPIFPPCLEVGLKSKAECRTTPSARPSFGTKTNFGQMSLDRIAQFALDDGGHGGSRNRLCFEVARRARTKDYTAAQVKDFLRGFRAVDGLPAREIETAVNSAFKGNV